MKKSTELLPTLNEKKWTKFVPTATARYPTEFCLPSKTDQSFADDCDINNIVNRFMKTGQISHLAKKQGFYADVSEFPDLLQAQTIVNQAHDAFMALPAAARKRFHNDPAVMIEFLRDPSNREEAIELGLIPKPTAQQAPTVPEPRPAASKQVKNKGKVPSQASTTTINDDDGQEG